MVRATTPLVDKIEPGMRFGKLVTLERIPVTPPKRGWRWLCQCDCGKTSSPLDMNLRMSRTRSCGCSQWKTPKDKLIFNGYVFVNAPNHPRSRGGKRRVREHILVMEKILGRYMVPGEEVHHKNGNRQDNHPDNLELWSHSQPAGQRVEDKVTWAVEILKMYAPEKLVTIQSTIQDIM